jgi:hypothetical protein
LGASSRLARDFSQIFPRKISIREKQELAGFEIAANLISIAIRFMTGVAALVSSEMLAAYELHRSLLYDLENYPLPPPTRDFLRKRLKESMYSETVVLAKYHYDKERDLAKFARYLREAEHANANGYEVLVMNSLKAFVEERDPLKALQFLKRARKVNDGEFTWLYNKAFIYMYLGKFELGYKDYKKLKDLSFPGDEAIIDQCLEFNKALIESEPNKIQCHFILGYLYMNKKCNFPLALEEFDRFIKKAKGIRAYDYLLERAVTYKNEVENKMDLLERE